MELQTTSTILAALQDELSTSNEKVNTLQSEFESFKTDSEQKTVALDEAKQAQTDLEAQLAEKEALHQKAQEQLEAVRAEKEASLNEVQEELKAVQAEKENLEKASADGASSSLELVAVREELGQRVKDLEEEVECARRAEGDAKKSFEDQSNVWAEEKNVSHFIRSAHARARERSR